VPGEEIHAGFVLRLKTLRKGIFACRNGSNVKKQQVNEVSGEELVARIRAEMAVVGLEPDGKEIELLAIAEALQHRIVEPELLIDRFARNVVDVEGGLSI
jgi:hypothetical protein